MEHFNDQANRELCEAHGITIYPIDIAWHTYIEVDNNGKKKTGTQRWLQYTMMIRGKWVKGYEDRIKEMYAFYASKIKKQLRKKELQAAAFLPLLQHKPLGDWFYVTALFVSICAIVALILLVAVLIVKIVNLNSKRKNL